MEIGPGNLKLSHELAKRFESGRAVDFEESVRDKYEALPADVRQRLSLHIGDLHQTHTGEQHSVVVSCEVLEHVEDEVGFLKFAFDHLEPNGTLALTVPAHMRFWTVHDEMVGHLRRYSRSQLRTLVETAGFEVQEIAGYGFPFINILWLARAVHGRTQKKSKQHLSAEERTKASGVAQNDLASWLGLIFNPVTFYLPSVLSRPFERFDVSEGYLLIAAKKSSTPAEDE